MNKVTKYLALLTVSTTLLNAENFSWTKFEKEINFDYATKYNTENKLTPEEKTKKYIKNIHNIDVSRESLKDIKEKKNDKIAVGLVFRNPKDYVSSTSTVNTGDLTNPVIENVDNISSLDTFGLKLSSRLDLTSLGMSGDKYANINVFGDLVEMTISKRIFVDDFDLGFFDSLNRWNGPYVEGGVGAAYQIKDTIKETGLSPMIMLGAGWNFKNEYEAKIEASVPSDFEKGTISRFSISSLF